MPEQIQSQPLILNVDDNEAMRYAKSRVLRANGFTVIEAGTGTQALQLIDEHRPALILLDVKLPDMNGMDICRTIRANPNLALTLVLQTSATFVDGSSRIKALDSGADSYLVEPMEPGELLANVRALLRLRRAEEKVRENERVLRLATSTAKLNTWNVDLSGRTSLSAVEFTGGCDLPAIGQLSSGGLYRLHPDDRDNLDAALAAALADSAPYDVQYRAISRNGDVCWIASQATVVRDAGGRAAQIIGVALDITERKRAEIEREELLKREQAARLEAEDATRLKDEFLATVSHELRTPLNAIIGWIHLLRSGQLDTSASTRALESIDRSAQSQSQLINDLLDVSRIISGKLRLDVRATSPVTVVEMALDTVRPAAQAKGVNLIVDLDRNIGLTAADPDRLQQVAWNLLTNAVKFSGKDGNIDVKVERVGSNVVLTVKDDGAGIDPHFLPFVFHPFRQADGSSTRKHPGLGLGLAIVRQLVELHGGRVRAESEGKGRGSIFTVTLPVRSIDDAKASPLPPGAMHVSGKPEPGKTPDLSGTKLLVVDDDEDARDILATVLRQAGANVTTASGAAEALAQLDREVPTVLLSDIGMPGQDGYSFIRAVRGRPADKGGTVPAIALTAYARSDDRFRALASGFQMHLAKPVEVSELLSVVDNLAKHSK
ncbi:MAG TPA: response regulator [Burkholderiales bacterium]|nr:response regulator [Burkholderiales bacterium]